MISRSATGWEDVEAGSDAVFTRRSTAGHLTSVHAKFAGCSGHLRPLLSASWKRSSTGTGTNTQFSGLGVTPTGELFIGPSVSINAIMSSIKRRT
jgi:hypothetical protein